MMEIETPKIEVEESEDRCYAKIVADPLEKGFGLTLGNALRRTLLSSLPGAAAQGIKFAAGVKHEFSTVPGVKEDVTDIILNIKGIAFKTTGTEDDFKKVLRLYKEGPAVVTAGDIADDAEVEVLNKDAYICTIDNGGVLDMDKVTDAYKELYDTNGGNTHLDGAYSTAGTGHTVFAQVFDGMDVVRSIMAVETDSNDKPLEDVTILSAEIVPYE